MHVTNCFTQVPEISWYFCPENGKFEAADVLGRNSKPGLEILPLFSRLSIEEQDRIFSSERSSKDCARYQYCRDFNYGSGHPLCGGLRPWPSKALFLP